MAQEAAQFLESAYRSIVQQNDRILAAVKSEMAGDYAALLRDLKFAVANAHEAYAEAGSLNYVEMQRYNRIKKYRSDLDKIVQAKSKPIYLRMNQGLEDVSQSTFTGSLAAIGEIANANIGRELSADEIQKILQKPWEGVTLEERIGLRRTDLGSRVKSRAVQGLIRGETYEDTAKGLRDVVLKDYAHTGRMAEDLGHQFQSDATQQSFDEAQDQGIRITKTWVTAGDNKVRDDHAALDGQTVGADEQFEIPDGPNRGMRADGPGLFGIPEEDYNCRCYIVAGIDEG